MAEVAGDAGPRAGNARRKSIVVVAAVVLVASGTVLVWNEYMRYWTVEDLAASVEGSPAAPGFKESLADRTVTVKGEVTEVLACNTTLGSLSLVELDGFEDMRLVYWGAVEFGVGDEVRKAVSFEWSYYNSETHVFSPDLDFPSLRTAMGLESYMFAYSLQRDVYWSSSLDGDAVVLEFDFVGDGVPLSDCSCSLREGEFSWAVEYVDIGGVPGGNSDYGIEISYASSLSSCVGSGGTIDYGDVDGDGELSTGDTMTVRGVEVPDRESGVRCYVLQMDIGPPPEGCDIECLPLYIPVMKAGIIRDLDSARGYVHLEATGSATGYALEVDFAAHPFTWSDCQALLMADCDSSDGEDADWAWLDLFAEDLDTGTEAVWSSDPVEVDGIAWTVSVTDVLGDGEIGVGDLVTISSDAEDLCGVLDRLEFAIHTGPPDPIELARVTIVDS